MNDKQERLGQVLGAQGPRQGSRGCKECKEEREQAWLPEEQGSVREKRRDREESYVIGKSPMSPKA